MRFWADVPCDTVTQVDGIRTKVRSSLYAVHRAPTTTSLEASRLGIGIIYRTSLVIEVIVILTFRTNDLDPERRREYAEAQPHPGNFRSLVVHHVFALRRVSKKTSLKKVPFHFHSLNCIFSIYTAQHCRNI